MPDGPLSSSNTTSNTHTDMSTAAPPATKVVAVAKDAPVGTFDAKIPHEVKDPERWLDLVELLELALVLRRGVVALAPMDADAPSDEPTIVVSEDVAVLIEDVRITLVE